MTQTCKQCGDEISEGIEEGIAHLEKKHKKKVTGIVIVPKTNVDE